MATGLVLRSHEGTQQFTEAKLRNVGKDYEGFFLKVDLRDQQGYAAQIYLYLDNLDVELVCENWPISLALERKRIKE